jgi:hypothetical protein
MKYLMVAFKEGRQIKLARNLTADQCQYFLQNVCQECDLENMEDVVIKKYSETDIVAYTAKGRFPDRSQTISVDKIEFFELVPEEYDTTFIVNTMSYPIRLLSELYSEADMIKIQENKNYVEALDPSIKNNPSVSIELPNFVPPVELPTKAIRKVKTKIGEVLPISE